MAEIENKKFVPTPAEATMGATPMTKAEVIESLANYKKQNPVKYETKKEALFARYGLTVDAVPELVPDANDVELVKLAKKEVTKK